jgi:dTDP-4-dehydrorhamnose 3,5-epimerase-like enzyme
MTQSKSTLPSQPHLYQGGVGVDDRGSVSFVNDFNFVGVKRFYQVANHQTGFIRAFHGHQHEAKYVYVSAGSALVYAVKLTSLKRPSNRQKPVKFTMSSQSPAVLFIPAGYANGFKSLTSDTTMQFFSTASLAASLDDDYRYPYDYWGEEIWQVDPR